MQVDVFMSYPGARPMGEIDQKFVGKGIGEMTDVVAFVDRLVYSWQWGERALPLALTLPACSVLVVPILQKEGARQSELPSNTANLERSARGGCQGDTRLLRAHCDTCEYQAANECMWCQAGQLFI